MDEEEIALKKVQAAKGNTINPEHHPSPEDDEDYQEFSRQQREAGHKPRSLLEHRETVMMSGKQVEKTS